MQGNPNSGIQETFARGIQNPENNFICLRDPESYALESGIKI